MRYHLGCSGHGKGVTPASACLLRPQWLLGAVGESLREMLPQSMKSGPDCRRDLGILRGGARRKREGGRALSYLSAFAT